MKRKWRWEQRALCVVGVLAGLGVVAFFAMAAYVKANPSSMPEERRVHLIACGLTKFFLCASVAVFFSYGFAHLASTGFGTLPLVVGPSGRLPRGRWWENALFATVGLGGMFVLLGLMGWLEPLMNRIEDIFPIPDAGANGEPAFEAGRRIGHSLAVGLFPIWLYFGVPALLDWRRPRQAPDDVAAFD